MNILEKEIIDNIVHLKYLKFEINNGVYTVTLNDSSGYGIVRGYGSTIIEAINEMHRCLI